MEKPDIRDFTRPELTATLVSMGEKASRVLHLFDALYKKGIASFDDMPDIQPEYRSKLAARYCITPPPSIEKRVSKLDGTVKLLFTFQDGARTESVILFNKETVSACISSQSGCACGCVFCATGALGFKRDLKPSEIVAQFAACRREAGRPLNSLIFMGMGEPFLNWANVRTGVLILSDSKGCNFPQTKMTISTVGIVPVIRELADSGLRIRLAISLITAEETQRAKLTPMAGKYSLAEIIDAARYYCDRTKQSVFLEYILFDGLNDSPEHARKLLDLIGSLNCKVNLIRYNPHTTGGALSPVDVGKAKAFQSIIVAAGIRTHLRRERGADIAAACGQLTAGG